MTSGIFRGGSAGRQALARTAVAAGCILIPLLWWRQQLGPMRAGGSVMIFTYDLYQYSLVHWQFAARMLRHGVVPLWNPYQLCGTPYLAVQNHGMLYPPNWLMLLLPAGQAMRLVMFAHYMLAMGGAYWCARVFGTGRPAALLAGVAYTFSGTLAVLGTATTPAMLASAAWLPWPLALTRKLLLTERHAPWVAVALGAAVAMAFLGGHPQHVMLSIQLCAAYGLTHLATVAWRRGGRAAAALVPRVALAAAVALGVAAVQLFPMADLMLRSPRGPGELANVGGTNPFPGMLPWVGLLRNAVYPLHGTFGTRGDGRVGLAPLVLAAAALLMPGPRRRIAFLWVIAVGAVLVALADQTPVFRWYLALPGATLFRVPQRLMVVASLAVAILGAMGADSLRRATARGIAVALVGGVAMVAGAYLVVRHWTPSLKPIDVQAEQLLKEYLALFALWAVLFALPAARGAVRWKQGLILVAVAATVLELYASTESRFALPMNQPDALEVPWAAASFIQARQGFARTFTPTTLWSGGASVSQVPPKIGMLTGVFAIADFENLFERRYAQLLAQLRPEPLPGSADRFGVAPRQLPLLRMLGVGFILVPRNATIDMPLPPPVYTDPQYAVYQLADPLPRAYVAGEVRFDTVPDRVLATVLQGTDFILQRGAVVEAAGAGLTSAGQVEITSYELHSVELRAQLERPGVVVLNDEFDPHWVATVDGRREPVWRTNAVFRGVRVDAGEHTVRFEYRPLPVYVGASVTGATVLALVAAAVVTARGQRLARAGEPHRQPCAA